MKNDPNRLTAWSSGLESFDQWSLLEEKCKVSWKLQNHTAAAAAKKNEVGAVGNYSAGSLVELEVMTMGENPWSLSRAGDMRLYWLPTVAETEYTNNPGQMEQDQPPYAARSVSFL